MPHLHGMTPQAHMGSTFAAKPTNFSSKPIFGTMLEEAEGAASHSSPEIEDEL